MVEHINADFKKHIITLEDPIEYVFDDNQSVIEQREIGLDSLSFEQGLKHILRQDPDIIMIGEMRDAVSFMAAINAADTGHLVLSTLHTTNASQADRAHSGFLQAGRTGSGAPPARRHPPAPWSASAWSARWAAGSSRRSRS